MIDKLISNSRTDPTIVDEVRDACSDIKSEIGISTDKVLAALASASLSGNYTVNPEMCPWIDSTLSHKRCNLFIVGGVSFDSNRNCFTIPKEKALRHRSSERYDVYSNEIRKFPALFITPNGAYKNCKNNEQKFYYGLVTDVAEQGRRDIAISFIKLYNRPMPQQSLNDIAERIGLSCPGVDLLNHTNWLIMKIDIRKALKEHGIEYA